MKIPIEVDKDKLFLKTTYKERIFNFKTSKIFYEEREVFQYIPISFLGINLTGTVVHISSGNSLWESTKSLEESQDFLMNLDFYVGEELLTKIVSSLLFALPAIEKNATNYFDGLVAERGKELQFLVSKLFSAVQQENIVQIQIYLNKLDNFYK